MENTEVRLSLLGLNVKSSLFSLERILRSNYNKHKNLKMLRIHNNRHSDYLEGVAVLYLGLLGRVKVFRAGLQRIVVGKGGEMWYTPDHYLSLYPNQIGEFRNMLNFKFLEDVCSYNPEKALIVKLSPAVKNKEKLLKDFLSS
jgi:hypothetical protein